MPDFQISLYRDGQDDPVDILRRGLFNRTAAIQRAKAITILRNRTREQERRIDSWSVAEFRPAMGMWVRFASGPAGD